MPSYVVETFLARGKAGERRAREHRAGAAAAELTRQGISVRFDRAIHIAEDEISFFVFDAPSRGDAKLAAVQAGLDPLRVVEAVGSGAA
jgi:hypothetical protein